MSQIHVPSSSEPPPPEVATSYETQNGTAVPSANILIVNGLDSNENNDNGIIVKGGVAGTGTSNKIDVVLTNRITGSVTTTDDTPTTLVSVSLGATPGVYLAQGDVIAYDVTDAVGASYTFVGAAVTDGVTGLEIGSEIKTEFEQAEMIPSDFNFGVSGNNATVTVTGILGATINWSCLFTYRFVG